MHNKGEFIFGDFNLSTSGYDVKLDGAQKARHPFYSKMSSVQSRNEEGVSVIVFPNHRLLQCAKIGAPSSIFTTVRNVLFSKEASHEVIVYFTRKGIRAA